MRIIGIQPIVKGPPRPRAHQAQTCAPDDCLVAIGASAGGPAALTRILTCLPANFAAPIVVVQHVDPQFALGLTNWLGDQTPLTVRLAQDHDSPRPGTILLAGCARHLVFTKHHHLTYTSEPADCAYRPSVDVFFNSALQHWRGRVIGVLLTGMGRDGAQGLRALRLDGHHTIAQDQLSSAVYGMPKAAAELKAATEILHLNHIGLRIRSLAAQGPRVHA